MRILANTKEDVNVSKMYGEECTLPRDDFIEKYKVDENGLSSEKASELIKNGIPIIYGTLINLLAELKNTYDVDNNISEMKIIKLYEKVDLLIIDDLGKEKPSEWGLEKLFTIINSRYENNLPVIITTNYNQNSLINRISINGEIETAKSIISRLYEMCYLVKIEDRDHRIKNKKDLNTLSANCIQSILILYLLSEASFINPRTSDKKEDAPEQS